MIHCGDIIGGGDSDGNPYIFTDGCGLMSMRAARRMSTTMHLSSEYPPSVFQVGNESCALSNFKTEFYFFYCRKL